MSSVELEGTPNTSLSLELNMRQPVLNAVYNLSVLVYLAI